MANNNSMEFGGTNYPGKAHELREENKENKNQNKTVVGESQYNSIKQAEGKTAMDSENNYNSVEAEEAIMKPKNNFVDSENLPDESAEKDIIDMVDKRLAEERARLLDKDPYGYNDLIDKLIEPAMARGDKEAVNSIIDRMSVFISDYQEVLKQNLSEEKEEEMVNDIFKKTMGNIVLSRDGKMETVELLPNFKHPKDAVLGLHGQKKIYYANEESTKGFMTKKEAAAEAYKIEKIQANKAKKTFIDRVKEEIMAFNPLTGKKEKVE